MIYRLRYCNKDGVEARVDIRKGSSTPVINVEGTERPFVLSYNNDKGNKSGMFLSSSADIEIYETPDFNINNLKTSNETELSVTHYIDNVVSWQGFIIPDFFSIEVRSNPVIAMTASDRLGTLKNVTLADLPSTISLRELAVLCLNKTGLTLPLRTMADFNNGTGINDFFNSKILTQRLSDTKGRSISCYDILSSILTASNSFLVQRSGAWHIINKIQHEAGSGKLYTGATSFINWSDVIFNFSDISIGGRRTIIPVASTVGVFHEFGGGKLHPDNYDFAQGTAGWVASGGYSMNIEDREIKGYSKSGSNWVADFGQTTTKKRLKVQNLLNFPLTNLDTAPYAKATFPLITTNTSSVDISIDMSVMGMPWYRTGVVVLAEKGTTRLAFSQSSGKFEPYDPQLATNPGYPNFMINLSLPVQGSAEDKSYYDASTKSMKFSGKLEDSDLTGWNITIRLYGYYSLQLGSRVDFPMFFSFANVSFSNTNEIPKGNIYKTEKDGDFTKAHDIDTSIFADYITYGLNGFFYEYPIDDTSSLYNSANELTTKWTAYNDTEQLPLLQHITRQRSRLFSVAHDLLSAEIEVNNFDPLAIFVACGIRHTVVSAQFDFFKSNLSVELEEIDFQSASARDFIYSYFGDGEEGIKSIGGVSGGGGGGATGGGLTPEQIEILSFWKKDPDRENSIFTEMNAYSTKELSAYGIGSGGGGGGGGIIETVYGYGNLGQTFNNNILTDTFNAYTINQINTRLVAVENDSGNLEIGGRNYISGNGNYSIRNSRFINIPITVPLSGQLTLSTSRSIVQGVAAYSLVRLLDSAGNAIQASPVPAIIGEGFSSITFSISTLAYTLQIYAGVDFAGSNGVYVDLTKLKLEKGNEATDWTPAPEDQVSDWLTTDVNSFSFIKNKPTTLAGYGITDATQRAGVGGTANSILSRDTRSVDEIPNTDRAEGMWLDFKSSSAIGLTGLGQGIYSGVLTILPYGDATGNSISGGRIALSNGNLFTQKANATDYTNWNKLAFITDNVASATKLQTPRTIWGQSFDGTGNVTGAITSNYWHLSDNATNPFLRLTRAGQNWYVQAVAAGVALGSSLSNSILITSVGDVGIGTTTPSEKLHVVGNILATGTTTTTKVIFNAAGWSMEQTGTELLLKYNNLIASRFLPDGSIVGLGEITAYGATTGGEGVSLLKTGGTMTGAIRWEAQNSKTPFIGHSAADGTFTIAIDGTTWQSGLSLGGGSGNLLWKGSQVLDKANTANKIEMGNGWTIEQTTASLTIRKDGVIKGTFNA